MNRNYNIILTVQMQTASRLLLRILQNVDLNNLMIKLVYKLIDDIARKL